MKNKRIANAAKPDFFQLASTIIALRKADLQLREQLLQRGVLNDGYHPEMEALHNKNAKTLSEIIDQIGYPTSDKVGKEASEAAWLVIQHAIGQPAFMKKCATLLQAAVHEKQADPISLAYLTDRIAILKGKPQLYGTQFDWDHNGELNPQPFDDLASVNQRRKTLGLHTLDEQTARLRQQTREENQTPPPDLEKRKQEYDRWRKKVGWIEER